MANLLRKISCDNCGSSDANAQYDDGSSYCFSCDTYKGDPNSRKEFMKPKPKVKSSAFTETVKLEKDRKVKEPLSKERSEEIKSSTEFDPNGYRGIKLETNRFYGTRYEYDSEQNIEKVYYPVTRDNELSGYKVREHPKTFFAEGATGNDCDLFGAFRFRAGGKYVLITEGEHDAMAAFQMLKEYNESKNSEFVTAVVSITVGAGNPTKQLQANYDFLNSFDNVIVGFDSDEPGQSAMEKVVSFLPKGKVRLAKWRLKDANKYLEDGKERMFIQDFYAAKPYVPAGVVASTELYDKILQQAVIEKVPFPPFLSKLAAMLGDGLMLGHIYNIAAMTSIGKTAIVNELIYYWIFNSPHLVGVVSMELNSGQYGETMLSRHLQTKLARLSPSDKAEQLANRGIIQKGKELFEREDGSPRFYLVDDRDGTVEQIQEVIEQMVIGSGVKIVVIDPLQDLIEGMSNEEQALFMKWCKSMIKSHGISFVLINHMRKKSEGTSSMEVDESDIMGSSTIMKSASVNILLARDKNHEDEVERNTTYVMLPKNRVIGDTGPAGKIYYDKYTHVMHDFDEYWADRPRPVSPDKAMEF